MEREEMQEIIDNLKNEFNSKIDKIITYIDKKEEEENEPIQEEIIY